MATAFDRWAKDPFFYAAEEVQESADRMESVYRRWMHEKDFFVSASGDGDNLADDFWRELHAALGTAKWQLEEFERAVRSSDHDLLAGETTINRHSDFVQAISNKISMVEKALKESNLQEKGENDLAWVKLDEGERDELALFLAGTQLEVKKESPLVPRGLHEMGYVSSGETSVLPDNPSCHSKESNSLGMEEAKNIGHRRVASACADLAVWKISVSNGESPQKFSDERPIQPPPRILSLSELRKMESTSKPKWYRNGFRKWKALNQEDMKASLPLRNHQLSRDLNSCYEKSKSCLSDCTDDSYNKKLYGWLGAFQRQIQRSQYQILYGRPIQMIFWTIVTVLLIGAFLQLLYHRTLGYVLFVA